MSFQQGLSGLYAASKTLEAIGNNIANNNTAGFKSSKVQFADVYASSLSGGGGGAGVGTKISQVAQKFSQGSVTASANPLDVAISGAGFFRMSNNGNITFSRNGQFQLDKEGYVVNASGSRLTGLSATNGTIAGGAPSEIRISSADLAPRVTTEVETQLNLDSRMTPITAAFDMNDPTTYHSATSVNVYDSLGNTHVLQTYYVQTAPSNWRMYAANDGVQVVGAGAGGSIASLTFDGVGALATSTPAMPIPIALTTTSGANSPYTVNLDLTGTTQFGSNFGVNSLQQDGFSSGRLSGFSIGSDGVITGRYTNGLPAILGQVVLANFTNPNGLQPLGNNAWAESETSGQALVGVPNSGSLGVIQSSAVEESNVDLTSELVTMITAQRVYQANAQTIKTQDQVLQTLVNLK